MSITNYYLVVSQQSDGSRIPPSSWTGSSAVLYQSFDSSDGFVMMEGTQAASNPVPLVSGKVGYMRVIFIRCGSLRGILPVVISWVTSCVHNDNRDRSLLSRN